MAAKLYNDVSDNELVIDIKLMHALYDTARWGKILAIVGFVFIGLTIVLAFYMQQYVQDIYAKAGMKSLGLSVFSTGFYAVFAFIYFFPSVYLYNFSRQLLEGLKTRNQELVNSSFRNLRILFKFMGILMILTVVIYGLAIFSIALGATAPGVLQ